MTESPGNGPSGDPALRCLQASAALLHHHNCLESVYEYQIADWLHSTIWVDLALPKSSTSSPLHT